MGDFGGKSWFFRNFHLIFLGLTLGSYLFHPNDIL